MDRTAFFGGVRSSLFGGRLSQPAVDGLEAIIASPERNRITDIRHVVNIMAQVQHETGGYILPIKETVYASLKDKNPPDEAVKKRLEAAFAKGRLSWVKTPYWRDGWFGRSDPDNSQGQLREARPPARC